MTKSTDNILQELEAEKNRRAKLSKEDLQKRYLELEKENFPSGQKIKFMADLGGSQEIAYHYELICKDWEEESKLYLQNSFDQHGREGIEFLFERLDDVEGEQFRIDTAFLTAQLLSNMKHRDFYASFCNRLIPILISLATTDDVVLRRKVIIALGWMGTSEEIDFLARKMLADDDGLCRAWSATSLMQMVFHRGNAEEIRERTKMVFLQAISEETEWYPCGIIIEAAQTIFGKRWISSSDVENEVSEKIEKAQKSAIRFLGKSENNK